MYLCIPFRKGGKKQTKFIDNTERDNEVKRDYSLIRIEVFSSCKGYNFIGKRVKHETLKKSSKCDSQEEKENKSERRMPWLPKAKKDVVSCEKLRGFANRN